MKKDLNAFFTSMRRQFGPFKYFWFLEFQKRGAPHFHVGTDLGPICEADRKVMAECWARIAEPYSFPYCQWRNGYGVEKNSGDDTTRMAVYKVHTHASAWEDVRKEDGAIRYVAKYATKPYQKTVPENYSDVGRFWAVSRGVKLEPGLHLAGSEAQVREILALHGRNVEGWEVLPKVVFI